MAAAPDKLTLIENRDLRGRRRRLMWGRRVGVSLLAALPALALLNVFGQRPDTSSAATTKARLHVYAPVRARSGIAYSARFTVDAVQELRRARLVLDPGWAEQYTVNGLAPQPLSEGSDDGRLSFVLGHIPLGRHYTMFLSLQVNPTNVGHRDQHVWLYDGAKRLVEVKRTITIWP